MIYPRTNKNDLQRFRKEQDKVYVENILHTTRQTFADFLSWHPNLYYNINLTTADIDFINRHYSRYLVDPQTFENEFIELLQMAVPRYNNMKSIELCDQVFDVTTNESERKIVGNIVNTLSRNSEGTNLTQSNDERNNKGATRQLPMQTNGGSTLDSIVKWNQGGSTIDENKSTGNSSVSGQDLQSLEELGHTDNSSKEKLKAINEQYVILISRIWNYLLAPKSTEYLLSAIKDAFILVY